jgi:hypothetical protein
MFYLRFNLGIVSVQYSKERGIFMLFIEARKRMQEDAVKNGEQQVKQPKHAAKRKFRKHKSS